jgi:hypothetical protein
LSGKLYRFSLSFSRERLAWVVYFSLGLCLVYCLFYLASFFGLSFFVLSNRGMVEQIVSGSLISPFWDALVWASSILIVLAWLFHNLGTGAVKNNFRLSSTVALLVGLIGLAGVAGLAAVGVVSLFLLVLASVFLFAVCFVFCFDFFAVTRVGLFLRLSLGLVLVGLVIEFGTLFFFSGPVVLNLGLGAVGLRWGFVESVFSNLGYPFLPFVYLLFVLFGVGAFVFRVFPDGWLWLVGKVRGGWFVSFLSGVFESGEGGRFGFLGGRLAVVLAVVVSAIVSILFVLFTVLPWSNPTGMLVSVDSPVYYNWITYMRSVDVNSALSFAFGNDRAVFLVLLYALSFVAPTVSVIQFAAALLIVLFGVVSLLILRLFCKSREVWVFGVLLVPFSFQSLGLIYSGYFANMLALILIFVYVLLFFKALGSWSSLGFFVLLGVSVLVLFSHSWTWFIFALTLVVFLFLQWRLACRDRSLWGRFKIQAILIGATIGVGLLSDLMRKLLSSLSSSASVLSTVQSSLGLPNFGYLYGGLRDSVDLVLGGVFANQLLILLSIVGFLVLLRFRSEVGNFFVAWVFVGCISILFAAESFVFDRFLFMMPWVVLSALGLFWSVRFVGGRVGGFRDWGFWVLVVVLVFVFLVLLNGALRFLFNINAW